ncbi:MULTISPECIES: hypothetical protein [unclassified Streptomyces]|uniref:hypothetical protein n=1 Tax=unclassified Streptomyces TaxID=2593676 RepID=UPI0022598622|nr:MULTISPECIES: hypothetical protein [unclassified Streptomyces]WSP58550.1 hypothetical protein OG306_32345 [Streptomyces sp. NBC_01241]WSU20873.1 hypothetical protein OG508_07655 [Streptomyces sp. NBC_01108]MCX4790321.1 hypothetical protein [Streptomyces sp. NBC_01221]MCX4793952.1 hypothetical protein [Streptomyces sp. NBC_01242]WSJ35366.1 hypothetical protein OG772_04370 [Streptomyces sp. NBC_01321]
MTTPPSERTLIYAEDLRPEDVHALETFLNVQLGRVYEEVGETGETSFAMRSLLILVCDSAGLLHTLLAVERPETWQRAAIVREWQRLRSTAHEFNHCEGYDHDRWWNQVRHFGASDETNEQARIRRFADVGPRPEAGH